MLNTITIATRESQLALWQANWVKNQLEANNPNLQIQLLKLSTQADRAPYISLYEIGGKGLFVKELEEALLKGEADIAVHSMKDMPVELPSGLILGAITERENPWDVLVSNKYPSLNALPAGCTVGTSSLRRQSFLLHLRSDIKTAPLRGNVLTRLSRLDAGEYDAIILAAAGLNRLGLDNRINYPLNTDFLPAAGQGALGIECREDDDAIKKLILPLNDYNTNVCVSAERAVCKALGASCQVPVAAYAEIENNKIILTGVVGSIDGKEILHAQIDGDISHAEELGKKVGEKLLAQGAIRILERI